MIEQKSGKKLIFICFLALGCSAITQADELKARSISHNAQDEWRFSITPYFWAASLNGNLGHRHVGTHAVKADFSKIWDNVRFMGMLQAEARKGNFSLHTDLTYIGSKLNYNLPSSKFVSKKLHTKGSVSSAFFGLGYTFYETQNLSLQIVGGAKIWHANIDFDIYANNRLAGHGKENGTWVDGLAGLKAQYRFNDKFAIDGWGMWGKGAAKSDWDVSLAANWSISRDVSLMAGYRMSKVDLHRRGFTYDIKHKGPVLGIKIDF
ncbi:hypothetical protein [Ignatzschineria sp. LJL83]